MRICQADWNHWPDAASPQAADPGCWAACAELGVAGVEVGVYDAADELCTERERARDLLVAEHGVPVASLLLSLPTERWPTGALTGDDLDRLLQQVTACAAAARGRGIDVLGCWPGADPEGSSWPACVDSLARCRDAADTHGVRLAVEYKPGTVVPTAEVALRLTTDVPGTGVLLDTGHAWAAGEDPADCVRTLAVAGVLWQVHLGDASPGAADDDLPLGALHSPAPLIAALDEAGYAGTAAFDLYGAVSGPDWTGPSALAASLAALR